MEKQNVQALRSPLKKHMPWLIAVTAIGGLTCSIVGIIMQNNAWAGMGVISTICSLCGMIVDVFLLHAVQQQTKQHILPFGLFIAIQVIFILLLPAILCIGRQPDLTGYITEHLATVVILILALVISGIGYFIMLLVMYVRFNSRFNGALATIGKLGIAMACGLIVMSVCSSIVMMQPLGTAGIVTLCIISVAYYALYFKYLHTVSKLMA